MKYLATISFVFISLAVWGQFSPVKRALDNIADGDALKASTLLFRALERDSLDPGVKYAFSRLYDTPDYPGANPDSAYYFILEARSDFLSLEEKEVERLGRVGVDSSVLEKQKLLLDSQAFEMAKETNSVEAYIEFQDKYPTARQYSESIELEKKVAFENASLENTHPAYARYMEQYPGSQYFEQALERYELLLYNDKTRNGKLDNYRDFLKLRPESPYRSEVEKAILEISTAGNRIQDFKAFFQQARDPEHRATALNIIYHVLKERGEAELIDASWWTDSLRAVHDNDYQHLYPIVDDKGYRFFDANGNLSTLSFPAIDSTYLCEGIEGDIVIWRNSVDLIIDDREGNRLYSGSGEVARDLGYGLIEFRSKGKSGLLHKSGTQLTPMIYDDLKIILGSYVATQNNGKWGLISFLGKNVLPNSFDEITDLNGNILIHNNGKIAISSVLALKKGADGVKSSLVFLYDEYEAWPGDRIWVRSGDSEGIINSSSSFDVDLGKFEIIPENGGYLVYGENNQYLDQEFNVIIEGWKKWVATKSLVHVIKSDQEYLSIKPDYNPVPYDSVTLWGNHFATVKNGQKKFIVFKNGKRREVEEISSIGLISNDFTDYLSIKGENNITIFNEEGELILQDDVDEAKALGKEYLVIERDDKQGLMSRSGEELLPAKYDAFGAYDRGGVSVLRKGLLGYFHLDDSLWIEPKFRRKVIDPGNGYLITYEEGGYQITDSAGEPVSETLFQEVNNWNDSSFLVKSNDQYSVYVPATDNYELGNLISIEKDLDNFGTLVKGKEGYGIIHPQKGVMIPPSYTFIEPIGELMRAEKYLRESDFYVVAFYNSEGKLIFREGLTPDQYDALICDQ